MQKKILVVDNSPVILRLLQHFLEKQGHQVQTAENGLAALAVLEAFKPDIIITDLIMPKISGDLLCRIVRSRREFDRAILIILSGVAVEEEIDFVNLGADACIAKGPAQEMAAHIARVVEQSRPGEGTFHGIGIIGGSTIFKREITSELLITKRHFEVTLEHMTDALLEVTPTGRIIYANARATDFFQVPLEQLLGTTLISHLPPAQRQCLVDCLENPETEPLELGEQQPLELGKLLVLMKFIQVREQGSDSILVLIQDISRRKRAEERLRQHLADLEEIVARRTAEHEKVNAQLREALSRVKMLSGIIPICASCKNIRDDRGYWNQVEIYIREHSEAQFSHSICPDCMARLYPDIKVKNT